MFEYRNSSKDSHTFPIPDIRAPPRRDRRE